jgi:hypothetical protein
MAIKRIEQVFPEVVADALEQYIDTVPWHYGWASNKSMGYTHWNYDFAKAGTHNSLEVSDNLPMPIRAAWEYIKQHHVGDKTLLRAYVNSHTYGIEGYPHTDSKREADSTILVYMNKEWRREWGGETMVYNGEDIEHAEVPRFNKGLIFPGAQLHCARGVTRICPAQRITLMFKFAEKNADNKRDDIQRFLTMLGADEVKHSGRRLNIHLLQTYDILKANGYSQDICNAGALHSIFGTNVFKKATLFPEQRDMVVRVIGEEATKLVDLFRTIKRPYTFEHALATKSLNVDTNDGKTITLNEDQLNSLCAIEAANLSDQKSLKNYPHLRQFIK